MKKKAIAVSAALLAVVCLAVLAVWIIGGRRSAVSQNDHEKQLVGKWAYIHDPDTEAVLFRADGRAEFEGKRYQFSSDGERIRLKDRSGGELALRYAQNDDKMYLYIQSRYVLENGAAPDGIVGVWVCREKNWSFEFTSKGTFMEDGVLTGHYFVDEENGTVRLVYGEVLEDTVFYYRLTDEGLFMEYPWLMVKMP